MQKSDTTAAGPVLTDVSPFQKMLDFGLQAENVNRIGIIIQIKTALHLYYMSKKPLTILYSNLLYKMGNYFLDIQYIKSVKTFWKYSKARPRSLGHS